MFTPGLHTLPSDMHRTPPVGDPLKQRRTAVVSEVKSSIKYKLRRSN